MLMDPIPSQQHAGPQYTVLLYTQVLHSIHINLSTFFCKFFVWKKENEQKEAVYWMDIFSHLFVVKIVMIVWNDVNKWKRGRDGPFKKPNSWNSLSETGSKELIVRATLGSISVKIEKRRTKQGKRRRDNKTFHYWYDLSIKILVFTLLTTQLLSNRFWQGC